MQLLFLLPTAIVGMVLAGRSRAGAASTFAAASRHATRGAMRVSEAYAHRHGRYEHAHAHRGEHRPPAAPAPLDSDPA